MDHFSAQAALYKAFRPHYPGELIDFISGLCRDHDLAWDCATGNGQSAAVLAKRFNRVIATDISPAQIKHASLDNNITYKVEPAERSSLEANSADLVTVSTALHWFDIDAFFREADRVLKNGGILAVWSYFNCTVSPEVDDVTGFFAYEFLKDYWSPQAKKLWWDRYDDLSFPYPLIETPEFEVQAEYNLAGFIQLMMSWSSVQAYIKRHSQNPVEIIATRLAESWGDPETRKTARWSLITLIGRKN